MISIPTTNIEDKIVRKFTSDCECFVKTTMWPNKHSVRPHSKAKFI